MTRHRREETEQYLKYMICTYVDTKYGTATEEDKEKIKKDILEVTGMTKKYFQILDVEKDYIIWEGQQE